MKKLVGRDWIDDENLKLSEADLQSIYQDYRHWIDDMEQQEDWWSGYIYSGVFAFAINFVLGYEFYDISEYEDPNDFGVFLYPVDPDGHLNTHQDGVPIDATDEFKAYLSKVK